MNKIDVKKIIKARNLEIKEVASHLFPKAKYPYLAMRRVLKGDALLDASQISKLALLSGLTVSELYGRNWKSKKVGEVWTFTDKDIKAELDTKTWATKLFDKGSLFHESVIHSGAVPLSQYLEEINQIIINYKNK